MSGAYWEQPGFLIRLQIDESILGGNDIPTADGVVAVGSGVVVPDAPLISGNGYTFQGVQLGEGLVFAGGTLSVVYQTSITIPNGQLLAGVSGQLTPVSIGSGLTLSGGTLSAAAAPPPQGQLLGSTGAAFTPVTVGNGLTLSGGTLTASGAAVSIPNAQLLGGTGSEFSGVSLGSGLSLTNGQLATLCTIIGKAIVGGSIDGSTTINGVAASNYVTQAEMTAAIAAAVASLGGGSGGSGQTTLTPNWAWRAGLKTGVNIERQSAINATFLAGALASCQAAGVTHVGMTVPYSPESDFLNTGQSPVQPFSSATCKQWFDAANQFVQAGIKVRLNCCDVTLLSDYTNNEALLKQQIATCAALYSSYNWPANMVAMSACSELAGSGEDAQWEPALTDLWTYLSGLLPANTPLCLGGGDWSYYTDELSTSGFSVPTALKNLIVCEIHTYDTFYSLSQWQGVASTLATIQQQTGCPAYIGETGLYNVNGGSGPYNEVGFIQGLGYLPTAFANYGFTIWSDSMSPGSGPINNSTTSGTFTPAMALNIAAANARMPGAPSALGVTATMPVFETMVFGNIPQTASGGSVSVTLTISDPPPSPSLSFWLDTLSTPVTPSNTAATTTNGALVYTLSFPGIADGVHNLIVEDTSNPNAGQTASALFGVGVQTISGTLADPTASPTTLTIATTGGLKKAYYAVFASNYTAYGPFVEDDLTVDASGNGTWSGTITHTQPTDYVALAGTPAGGDPVNYVHFAAAATAPTVATSLTINGPGSPVANATITLTGDYQSGPPEAMDYELGASGTWAALGSFSAGGGTWSGTMAGQPSGSVQVTVRDHNATSVTATVSFTVGATVGTIASIALTPASTTLTATSNGTGAATSVGIACGAGAENATAYWQIANSAGTVYAGQAGTIGLDSSGNASLNVTVYNTGDVVSVSSLAFNGGAPATGAVTQSTAAYTVNVSPGVTPPSSAASLTALSVPPRVRLAASALGLSAGATVTTVADQSGYGNNATAIGAPLIAAPYKTYQAIHTNGSTSALECDAVAPFLSDPPARPAGWTVAIVVMPKTLGNNTSGSGAQNYIWDATNSTSTAAVDVQLFLGNDGSGRPCVQIDQQNAYGPAYGYSQAGSAISTTQPTVLTCASGTTFNSTTGPTLYVNGTAASVGSNSSSVDQGLMNKFLIGAGWLQNAGSTPTQEINLEMYTYELIVWDSSLTVAQIQADATALAAAYA